MMSFFLLFVCLVVEFRFSLESSSFLIKLYLRVLKIDVEKKNQKKRKKTEHSACQIRALQHPYSLLLHV